MMKSKYRAKKTVVDGITFDSLKEAGRYATLRELQEAGVITDLQLQVKFVLIPVQRAPSESVYKSGKNKGQPKPGAILERECSYIADFVYKTNGILIVEDAKGMRTKEYIIKRKLMLERHGIKIREV